MLFLKNNLLTLSGIGIMEQLVLTYLVLINLATFTAYGIDKRKAKKSRWRIPEATLLWLAAAGGGLGAWAGMKAFHHKTRHKKFTILVPLLTMIWVAGLVYFRIKS